MLKRRLPKIPKKQSLLALGIVLVISAVGVSQPIFWPGGFGIGKEQSVSTKSVETVVKDAQGNTTKTVETTKNDDGKTLWDWLSLLGVPVSLAVLGYILQQLQQKRAEVLAKEEVLQVYFDRLSALLVDKNLLAISTKGDNATNEERELLASAMDVIRARTLSILRRFENDPERKTDVMRFLIEADMVSKLKLDLRGANLRGVYLGGIDLSDADLSGTDLSQARFGGATLIRVKLIRVKLIGADFFFTDLEGVDFSNADLSEADFTYSNVTVEQLVKAKLCNTTLPSNMSLNPDRDCNRPKIPKN